jgi:hypothetical protein
MLSVAEDRIKKYGDHILDKLRDPFFFIQKILGVEKLTKQQKMVIESVWSNKFTGVKAAHSVGKTFLGACITLAYIVPNPNTIVITTAPTMRQVKDLLWAEINYLYQKAKYPLGGKMLTVRYELAPKWFAEGLSTDPGKEEVSAVKLQGYHANHILIILDEAVGIHPTIWEAIDGITNSENAKVLAIGNPSTTNCVFYKNLQTEEWNSLTISALEHPNVKYKKEIIQGAVSYKWVKDKIRKWCVPYTKHNEKLKTFEFENVIYKPNSLFLWKVLGEFPLDEAERFISVDLIERAMQRGRIQGLETEIRDMAIDVARYGGDASVIAVNIGNNFEVFKYFDLDLTGIATEAIKLIKKYKPHKVGVDCDGIGAGVFDIINEQLIHDNIKDESNNVITFDLYEIHSSAKMQSTDDTTEKFANLKTQMWAQLKKDLDYIKLPDDDDLEEELNAPKVKVDRFGKTILETKDEIRKRIGRSTDIADAVVYCNWLKYIENKNLKFFFID